MNFSPLQLKRYSFVEFWVKQNPHSDFGTISEHLEGPYPEFKGVTITPKLRTVNGQRNDNQTEYYLSLRVSGTNDKDSVFPYEFGAEIFGSFELQISETMTDPDRVAAVNGASILYGIIRDQLLTLTHKSIHGPIMLPTADFRNFEPKKQRKPKKANTAETLGDDAVKPRRRVAENNKD
jgi:preprotein translocase subunit SecB